MIINGALECGPSPANPDGSSNRQKYYRRFAAAFGVDISGEKLGKLRWKSQRKIFASWLVTNVVLSKILDFLFLVPYRASLWIFFPQLRGGRCMKFIYLFYLFGCM
jgi:hypothetical protein